MGILTREDAGPGADLRSGRYTSDGPARGDLVFEIGATLREARERHGVTFADAEEATRIRARHLAALEDERFAELPGDAYARSFLREYGEFLGLDGQRLVAEYSQRFATSEPLYVEPVSVRGRRAWRGWLIGFAALAVVAIVVAAVVVPGGGRRPARKAGAAPPRAHPGAARNPGRTRRPPRAVVPHLQLVASRGDCWLEIHAGSRRGPLLHEGILPRGGSLTIARRFLWIRIGAPASLDVRLNGRRLPLVRTLSPVNVEFALRRLRVLH
jgi:cytoskeleton protein RodZ